MPNLTSIIQHGTTNPWIYLPVAILLGALHALEPGHSKSLMAAFMVAVRGTIPQAVLLGLSAATGHTIIVWVIALAGLYVGDKLFAERAEPWLILVSGLLIMALAMRLIFALHREPNRTKHHDHHHHTDEDAHAKAHEDEIAAKFSGRKHVTTGEIFWFGFTGGLLPCPAAIAVLLVCLQLKKLSLGITMVAAFSLGLALTLIAIGALAAWGTSHISKSWACFETWSHRLPYISAAILMVLGVVMTARGLMQIM
jgi:nickel/cobalt transporter (NicO) family protein